MGYLCFLYMAPTKTVTTDARLTKTATHDANVIVRYLAVSRAVKLHTAATTCTSSRVWPRVRATPTSSKDHALIEAPFENHVSDGVSVQCIRDLI